MLTHLYLNQLIYTFREFINQLAFHFSLPLFNGIHSSGKEFPPRSVLSKSANPTLVKLPCQGNQKEHYKSGLPLKNGGKHGCIGKPQLLPNQWLHCLPVSHSVGKHALTEHHWLPIDILDREQQMLLKPISRHREEIPVWEQLATDQTDHWQVVLRQVFTLYSRLLISNAFAFVNCIGCLGVSGVGHTDLSILKVGRVHYSPFPRV